VKAGGKQSNRLAEILDYTENRMEMEARKSVPVGSPVGQNDVTKNLSKSEAICFLW
jgi:hypothetical protein